MNRPDIAIVNTGHITGTPDWKIHAISRRIPADVVGSWREANQWLSKANQIYKDAVKDADEQRRSAVQEGLEQGRKIAMQEQLQQMQEIQQQAAAMLMEQESKIIDLTIQLLQKILPDLDQQQVVNSLISKALKVLNAERYIVVYVGNESVEFAKHTLARSNTPGQGVLLTDVVANPALGPYDCIVQSDLGTIHCGVKDQLNRILEQIQSVGEGA